MVIGSHTCTLRVPIFQIGHTKRWVNKTNDKLKIEVLKSHRSTAKYNKSGQNILVRYLEATPVESTAMQPVNCTEFNLCTLSFTHLNP